MEINLTILYNRGEILIDDDIAYEDLASNLIKKLDPVHIKGYVKYNLSEEIELNLDVKGKMFLTDSITLDLIPYEFKFTIAETFTENDENFVKITKNNQNILDIKEILWENIVLEVPISYTQVSGKKLKGDGWELNGE